MKIVLISAAFPPHHSGEAFYALKMADWLRERGHEVRIASSQPTPGGIQIAEWDWDGGEALLAALKEDPPDAIVLHYTDWIYGHPMVTWLPTLVDELGPRPRFITLFHNHIHLALPEGAGQTAAGVRGWWQRQRGLHWHGSLLRKSDNIVVLAEWHRRWLIELEPECESRCATVPVFSFLSPTGQSRKQCRKAMDFDSRSFWISFYGYVYGDKDLSTLFRAVALLRGRGEDARVLMIGGAPEGREKYDSEWRRLAEEAGIAGFVRSLGRHSSFAEEPSVALSACDVCVLPFRGGAGTRRSSLAAALAHGVPVLSTLGPETPHELLDRDGLILFRPGDSLGLARELETLLQDEGKRARHSEGALQLHAECFSFERAMESFDSLLRQERSAPEGGAKARTRSGRKLLPNLAQ